MHHHDDGKPATLPLKVSKIYSSNDMLEEMLLRYGIQMLFYYICSIRKHSKCRTKTLRMLAH